MVSGRVTGEQKNTVNNMQLYFISLHIFIKVENILKLHELIFGYLGAAEQAEHIRETMITYSIHTYIQLLLLTC